MTRRSSGSSRTSRRAGRWDKILKEYGVEAKHVMEFDNIETVKRAVEIDAGISIVPRGTISQEIAKQTLVGLPIADGIFTVPSP